MARIHVLVLVASLAPSFAFGQTIGTFRWQLAPFCNIVALAVTQNVGVFEIDGTDDQCGASGTHASAIGTAFFNPDGTVGMGLNIISTGGIPVHVDATIVVSSLGGSWRDSAGNTGSFVFTPGAGTGGSPRPTPAVGVVAGSVGSAQVNPTQVQLRIAGTCPSGQFMQSVAQSGSVDCEPEAGDISAVVAGFGLAGGESSGSATLGLPITSNGAFLFDNLVGVVAVGAIGSASIPASGDGTRMMWYPGKAAFRSGSVTGGLWDDANIGNYSVAFGGNTMASGPHSVALGDTTVASGAQSVAMGYVTMASGSQAFAMGDHASAGGNESVALGNFTVAQGHQAVAMGFQSQAGGDGSVALGSRAITGPAAHGSFVFADQSSDNSFTSPAPNEFGVRAAGGIYLYTSSSLSTGCSLPMGSGTWACASDRNSKESFEPVDGEVVLTKLRAIPIERWSYRSEPGVRHVGPVAQDFYAAFGLGVDDKTVGHLDLSGISLRAIQALEARTRDLQDTNDALRAELAVLRERLARLGGLPR